MSEAWAGDRRRRSPEAETEDEFALDPEVLRRRRENVLTIVALAAILAVAGGLGFYVSRSAPPPKTAEVIAAAQRAVRAQLAGMAVSFPSDEETTVKQTGDAGYEVAAFFTAITREGQSSNYTFVCVLERLRSGGLRTARLSIKPVF